MGLREVLLAHKSNLHLALPIEDSPEFDLCYIWRKKPGLSESAALYLEYAKTLYRPPGEHGPANRSGLHA
jgi:hypothetical protein